MTVARALLFNAAFYLWTLAMMLCALVGSIGRPHRVQRFVPVWSRSSLWLLARVTGLRYEVRGLDRLPPEPYIVAAKHQSAWDILALTVLFPEAGFVLKQELRRLPLFGYLAVRAGHIAVNRGGHARALTAMVAAAKDAVTRGRSLIVFPQGTRTHPGEIRPYQVGIAALYVELGVPVVPVALNSGLFWPRRWPVQRAGTILVEVLPPISPGLERRAFLAALSGTIEDATSRLEAEARASR